MHARVLQGSHNQLYNQCRMPMPLFTAKYSTAFFSEGYFRISLENNHITWIMTLTNMYLLNCNHHRHRQNVCINFANFVSSFVCRWNLNPLKPFITRCSMLNEAKVKSVKDNILRRSDLSLASFRVYILLLHMLLKILRKWKRLSFLFPNQSNPVPGWRAGALQVLYER